MDDTKSQSRPKNGKKDVNEPIEVESADSNGEGEE